MLVKNEPLEPLWKVEARIRELEAQYQVLWQDMHRVLSLPSEKEMDMAQEKDAFIDK